VGAGPDAAGGQGAGGASRAASSSTRAPTWSGPAAGTGRSQADLSPDDLRKLGRQRPIERPYLATKLDLLEAAVHAGGLHKPRGFLLRALGRPPRPRSPGDGPCAPNGPRRRGLPCPHRHPAVPPRGRPSPQRRYRPSLPQTQANPPGSRRPWSSSAWYRPPPSAWPARTPPRSAGSSAGSATGTPRTGGPDRPRHQRVLARTGRRAAGTHGRGRTGADPGTAGRPRSGPEGGFEPGRA